MKKTRSDCKFSLELTQLIPRLSRFALVLTRNEADAEDLVQTTLVRALDKQKQWRIGSNLDRWVFTIQSSIWKNNIRSSSLRHAINDESIESHADNSPKSDPQRNFLLQQVLKEVMQLPEIQRIPILLVYVEGFSYQETSDILVVPIGTVMSRLMRGRIRLAEKFKTPASKSDIYPLTQDTKS